MTHDDLLPLGHLLPTLEVTGERRALQQVGSYEVTGPVCGDQDARLQLGRNTRLGRLVTLHELVLPDRADRAGAAQLAERARKATRLRSPHLVEIHDYLQGAQDQHFAVMEPLFGETLRARISRGGLSINEAVDLAQAIGAGLQALHAAGRVHAGLHSSAVFLSQSQRGTPNVKLLDHGLGAGQQMLLRVDQQAPEQRASRSSDSRTDVYFLGRLLLEMLEGKASLDPPAPPEQTAAGEPVPASLRAVLAQCLKPNPSHRYQSPAVFCSAVREALGQAAFAPASNRWPKRGRWLLAALLLPVGGSVAWIGAAPTSRQAAPAAEVEAPPSPRSRPEQEPEVPSLPPYVNLFIAGARDRGLAEVPARLKVKRSRAPAR